MAQAIRTMGAVLNDATEGLERGMESRRREAITNVQLKGEIDNQDFQRSERERLLRIRDRIAQAGKETFEVEETVPGAISQDADGATIRSPDAKRTRVINPFDGSPEAVAATATWLGKVGKIRMEEGEFTPEQMQAFQQSMDYSETRGIRQAVRRYFATNDQKELAPIEKMFGMQEGSFRLTTENQNGIPSIVAEGVQIINGKPQKVTRDMEMWFTMNGITEPTAAVDKKVDRAVAMQNAESAGINARANAQNARTNADRLSARVLAQGEYEMFEKTAEKNAGNAIVPIPSTDRTGKVMDVKDAQYDGFVRRIGGDLIGDLGMSGSKAYNTAARIMSGLGADAVALHEQDVNNAKARVEAAREAGDNDELTAASRDLLNLTRGDGPSRNWLRHRQQLVTELLDRAGAPKPQAE